jgi:MEMO1 family protein
MNTRRIFSALMLVSFIIGCRAQDARPIRPIRPPAAAGRFYEAEPAALKSTVRKLLSDASAGVTRSRVAALILPHAGYLFSGGVAARGIAQLDTDAVFDNIFLIGASHHIAFPGASVFVAGDFSTPLGVVPVNVELGEALAKKHPVFSTRVDAHDSEHSLEVQLPFLQVHLRKPFRIVPIILGTESPELCRKLAEALRPYFTPENLFIVSSDFSHYPEARAARRVDSTTAAAIATGSPRGFIEKLRRTADERIPELATSACGASAIVTLLYLTESDTLIERRLDIYRNSGDAPVGRKEAVVGYWSITFARRSEENSFVIRDADQRLLLRHARATLERRLSAQSALRTDSNSFPESARRHCGAFVTLRTRNGDLRGCIGQFVADQPLYEVIHDMAIAAATQDPRFGAVTRNELDSVSIEISVLTPLRRISSASEFELGKHGIYMRKGGRSGTFLPQVAKETGWSRDEFLGHCARDKAGIGWDGWKDAELYTYEAIVFGER